MLVLTRLAPALAFGLLAAAPALAQGGPGVWRTAAPLPTARSGIAGAALGGRVHVFGGEEPAGTFADNEAYDPATDTWLILAPMPTARHGLGAATVGNAMYILAGGDTPGFAATALNEAFTLE